MPRASDPSERRRTARGPVWTIARLEFAAASRQHWVRFFGAAFALLTMAIAYSSGAVAELGVPDGFARTTVALVPLVIVLVPLAALLLGVSGHTGEPGSEVFLFAQPVSRSEVVVGRWLGQALALSCALGIGFGAGAAFVAGTAGAGDLPRFAGFVLTSVLLGIAFLSIAALIAAKTGRKATALGVAAFLWFFLVLLYDALALGAAGWIAGRTGARILFASVFGNPADLARVLALSLSGTPHVLGAAGEAWSRFLGGPIAATLLAAGALLFWIAAPLETARRVTNRRDL